MKKTIDKRPKIWLCRMRRMDWPAIGVIAGFYLVLERMGVTCPILFLTGVSCGGCGMSRAWLSLCRLDLAGAFHYHPLFWLPVPAAILLFCKDDVPKRWFMTVGAAMLSLFLAVYFVRMCTPRDAIVVFRPADGLFYRIWIKVSGFF